MDSDYRICKCFSVHRRRWRYPLCHGNRQVQIAERNMNKAKKKRCLNLQRWIKAKKALARKRAALIGKVIFRGRVKNTDQAIDQTLDHFGFHYTQRFIRSGRFTEFFVPKQGWVRINFTEPYSQVSSPGLPTISLPMAYEAVITELPAE